MHKTQLQKYLLRFLVTLIFSGLFSTSSAQKMVITSFEPDEADMTANISPTLVLDQNGDKCALIKIVTTQRGFTFNVGLLGVKETVWQDSIHPSEIWLYVPKGVKAISIQHPKFGSIRNYDFGFGLKKGCTYIMELSTEPNKTQEEEVITIALPQDTIATETPTSDLQEPIISFHRETKPFNFLASNEFYAMVGYSYMRFSGLSLGVGGFYRNINIEGNVILGLTKSDRVFWVDSQSETATISANYSPIVANLKAGYGIKLGKRIKLTPQIGCYYTELSEKLSKQTLTDFGSDYSMPEHLADGAYSLSISAGVRVSVALTKNIGLSVTNEYLLNIKQTEGFTTLSNISSQIKNYNKGYGLNISLTFGFSK